MLLNAEDIHGDLSSEEKETLRKELAELLIKDDGRRAGWYHDYFCDDGTRLTFDINKPYEHVCPECGKTYSEDSHNKAWVSELREKRIKRLVTASFCAKNDPSLMEPVIEQLEWIAEQYRQLPLLDGWKARYGASHLGGTVLEESVAICKLCLAVAQIYSLLSKELKRALQGGFLVPACDLLLYTIFRRDEQAAAPHNIWVWHGCALACSALLLKDEQRLLNVFNAPLGLKYQLENGPGEDGLWYEGSLGYHFYTAEALTYLIAVGAALGRELPFIQKHYIRMLGKPVDLYFSNGHGVAYGDTWAPITFERPLNLYTWAAGLVEEPCIASSLERMQKKDTRAPRTPEVFPGFSIALAGPDDWEVSVKSGHLTKSHAHPDTGSIILLYRGEEVAGDPGTTGYAAEINKWFRAPFSHNTVMVDNGSNTEKYLKSGLTPGSIRTGNDFIEIEGTIAQGCRIERRLEFRQGRILDTAQVSSDTERLWTWLMHFNLPFDDLNGDHDSERFGDISWIQDVCRVQEPGVFRAGKVCLTLENTEHSDGVYIFTSPANKKEYRRHGIAWDKECREAEFRAVWTAE